MVRDTWCAHEELLVSDGDVELKSAKPGGCRADFVPAAFLIARNYFSLI